MLKCRVCLDINRHKSIGVMMLPFLPPPEFRRQIAVRPFWIVLFVKSLHQHSWAPLLSSRNIRPSITTSSSFSTSQSVFWSRRERQISGSPKRPDRLWDPHSTPTGQRGLLPQGVKRWRLTLTTDLHLMPRFRMSGVIPLFPRKHSWRTQRHFIFYLCTHKYTKPMFYALVVLLKKLGVNRV